MMFYNQQNCNDLGAACARVSWPLLASLFARPRPKGDIGRPSLMQEKTLIFWAAFVCAAPPVLCLARPRRCKVNTSDLPPDKLLDLSIHFLAQSMNQFGKVPREVRHLRSQSVEREQHSVRRLATIPSRASFRFRSQECAPARLRCG